MSSDQYLDMIILLTLTTCLHSVIFFPVTVRLASTTSNHAVNARTNARNNESHLSKCKSLVGYHQANATDGITGRSALLETAHSHLPPSYKIVALRAAEASLALKGEVLKVANAARDLRGGPFPEEDLSTRPHMIVVCPALKLGYVHIYKAGGTSAIDIVQRICPDQCLVQYQNWGSCETLPHHSLTCCTKAIRTSHGADRASALDGLTLFTTVRDPVERFRSGLGEILLRFKDPDAPKLSRATQRWISRIIKGAAERDTRVDVAAIQDLSKAMKNAAKPNAVYLDPHIQFQSWFISTFVAGSNSKEKGRVQVLPQLDYVFPFSDLNRSLTAVALMFSGYNETFIKSKIHHNRDFKSQMYQEVSEELSLYETLRGDPLPDTMVMLLKEFYSVDYTVFSNTF